MGSTADWTERFELQGEARRQALAKAQEIIAGWGLVMPPGEPLPLSFGLGDFDRIGEIEYWIVNDTVNGYCGKFLFMFEGQRCPGHHHRIKDETFYIVRGVVEMELNGETTTMNAGDVLKVGPGSRFSMRMK